MKSLFLLLSVAALSSLSAASYTKPPVLPLFVRNPYLSLWLNARHNPWDSWPIFWHGQEIGFGVMAQIPATNTVYPLIGRPQDALLPAHPKDGYTVQFPTYTGFQYDSSTTNLTYSLPNPLSGDVLVTLMFTSPITPESTERQALPASYVEVIVEGQVDVNIYVDLNGLWVTHERKAIIQWGLTKGENLTTWSIHKQDQWTFAEISDRAEWGVLHFTGPQDPTVTYEAGVSGPLRRRFSRNATLANTYDTGFREVMNEEPVFSFSKHFALSSKKNHTKTDSVLFTVALIQDPVTQFAAARGLTQMRPLWRFQHATDTDMISYHYFDYPNAYAQGKAFADKVTAHARAVEGDTYADIVSISARQVMGATVFAGTPEDPILFLKEISSNGNFQTVDVIFPGFTFFLYANPKWLAYLLEPLLEHQMAGLYPNKYSIHDLGAHFPNATGHPDGNDEPMPVEECGNMLAMALAYVQTLNDGSKAGKKAAQKWIDKGGRYALWKQWTGYLTEFGLIPAYQLSTDDFAGRLENQTNLAMKAIVGIKAMAELSSVMGNTEDADYYTKVGDAYVLAWIDFSMSRDGSHTKLAYHLYGSWGTLYNLYPDSLLCFAQKGNSGYIPHDIYRKQSRWYSAVHQKYGLPLDTRHLYTKSDWEVWAAAISSKHTRTQILELMGLWLNETITNRPFPDLYDTETSDFPGIYFMARPVAGGHFALLALDEACGGTGLSFLEQNIFSSPQEEKAFSAAIDPDASRAYDYELTGTPVHGSNVQFPPFPPGEGWPNSCKEWDIEHPPKTPEQIADKEKWHPKMYLTKQYLTDGIGCWWKGGCGDDQVVYTRPSEYRWDSVDEVQRIDKWLKTMNGQTPLN
ncbi:uncharacterized protein H6S33_003243 [Morchella sextelata]|uniref:uncharacterized protein n=1 Tax=Morchella sextelata TaxID=1174677 RepID=UPI001D0460D9|nr:uncharacterized protein H6S33_003243 [Morchella sextelata]KAH0607255.1 hypothetical protein H6S33_003243 [Morchella sextelata]